MQQENKKYVHLPVQTYEIIGFDEKAESSKQPLMVGGLKNCFYLGFYNKDDTKKKVVFHCDFDLGTLNIVNIVEKYLPNKNLTVRIIGGYKQELDDVRNKLNELFGTSLNIQYDEKHSKDLDLVKKQITIIKEASDAIEKANMSRTTEKNRNENAALRKYADTKTLELENFIGQNPNIPTVTFAYVTDKVDIAQFDRKGNCVNKSNGFPNDFNKQTANDCFFSETMYGTQIPNEFRLAREIPKNSRQIMTPNNVVRLFSMETMKENPKCKQQ